MTDTRSALVIDDERDIRELLVMTLGRMGLRCDTASSLSDARAQLARNQYDLCLTDMRLPDCSGLDLVAKIANTPAPTLLSPCSSAVWPMLMRWTPAPRWAGSAQRCRSNW